MTSEVFIVSAARTPIGSLNGSLSALKAHSLGAVAIEAALARAGLDGRDVSEVIMGQVLNAGQGMNPARQASMAAGVPYTVPAWGVNMVCGSGLKAVALGVQAIQNGDASIIVAGGQESMSQAPHVAHMRTGVKFGEMTLRDSLISDGLTDAFNSCHMGITAENIRREWNISREDQDSFALMSQQRASAAQEAGRFVDEIVPVKIPSRKGDIVFAKDEHLRPLSTLEGFSALKPVFEPTDGTVTAGNASGINDGAAALVLVSAMEVERRDLKPLAKVVAFGQAGVSPHIMGIGPVPAIHAALKKAGWNRDDVDLWELNEAFAVQSLAVIRDLMLDPLKVNVNGGGIALGHPVGASGARILVTLLYALKNTGGKRGVTSLCAGGGMGVALCIEML